MNARKQEEAFTLIELLVVIAIIAVLAAILFPVFARAKDGGRKAACQSNLRQLGTAVAMYVQDWDETFPSSYVVWDAALWPYLKNVGILHCPSDVLPRVPSGGMPRSYSINSFLISNNTSGFFGTGMKMSKISDTSNTVCICENWQQVSNWSYALNVCLSTMCEGYGDYPQPYHPGVGTGYNPMTGQGAGSGANYLYFDGHVKWINSNAFGTTPTQWATYYQIQ
jgi:prepilin-type N-terminal cleavage/methylation domain-containing protein/prepilin-type processing-associated H-X9-DG protein